MATQCTQESGFYYLQSRYYDPETGRFLCADDYTSTGQGFIGNNAFSYCLNNPQNLIDPSGYCANTFSIYFKVDCGKRNCPTSSSFNPTDLYKVLTDLAAPNKDGHTFSAGLTAGNTTGNTSQSVSICVSADSSNNYAIQSTTSHSGATGAGASVAVVLTYTNANNVLDLEGTSESWGGTFCLCEGVAIDYISFSPSSDPNKKCWGISVSISSGGEIEGHRMFNYTSSTDSWNLWAWLRDAIYS